MLRLALTFPIHDVLGVIYGKELCTNETPVFTQHKPLSEVDRGDGVNSKRKRCCCGFFSCAGNWTLLWYSELESLSGKVPALKREICSSLTQQYIISNPNHPSHLNVNHSRSKLSCVWAYGLEQSSAGPCSARAASCSSPGGEGWHGAGSVLLQGCSVAQKPGWQSHAESSTTPTSSEGAGWVSSVLTELQQALPVGLIHQPLPLVGGAILVVHLSPAAPLAVAPLALVELPVGVKERPPALDSSTDMAG